MESEKPISALYDVFSTPPNFVNEDGVKWWLDKSSTQYARKADIHGTSLPNIAVFIVERLDGYRTRVLVGDNAIIAEHQGLESMAVEIDKRKFIKRTSEQK